MCRLILTVHIVGFQVGTDPAGDGDAEGSRELLQGADQGADLHVQEQVSSCPTEQLAEGSQTFSVVTSISIYSLLSWLKVTEHLADRNLPIFTPGTKVTPETPHRSIIDVIALSSL